MGSSMDGVSKFHPSTSSSSSNWNDEIIDVLSEGSLDRRPDRRDPAHVPEDKKSAEDPK